MTVCALPSPKTEPIELDGKIDLTLGQKQAQSEYEAQIAKCKHKWGKFFVSHSSISEVRYIKTCSLCHASQYGYGNDWDEPIGLLQAPRRDHVVDKFKAFNWKENKWEDAYQGCVERFWHGEWIETTGKGYSLLTRKERAKRSVNKCRLSA